MRDVKYERHHNTSQLDEVEKSETQTTSTKTTVIQDDGRRELTQSEKKHNEEHTYESEGNNRTNLRAINVRL